MNIQNSNPEIGQTIQCGPIRTNYHDIGNGEPVLMLHGSGPGVSAWANWRLTIAALEPHFRVLATQRQLGLNDRPLFITQLYVDFSHATLSLKNVALGV